MVFNLLSLFTMNKKHLLLFVFFYISFVCNTHAESYAHDTLVNVLRNEVQFYFDKLKNKETPAYFISLRVVDNKRLFLSSDFGLSSMDENHPHSTSKGRKPGLGQLCLSGSKQTQ